VRLRDPGTGSPAGLLSWLVAEVRWAARTGGQGDLRPRAGLQGGRRPGCRWGVGGGRVLDMDFWPAHTENDTFGGA
jgi:hypothetical protein